MTQSKKLFSLDRYDLFALLICLNVFVFWLNLLIKKFIYYGYYDWDLAMYSQAVWALTQGSLHSSLFGTSFLTNHAEYIAFFLAPIYKLFPNAFTLVFLKILAFVSGSFIFYLITKKLLGWRMAIIFMLMYQFHPANLFMLIYEFHFENLAITFIFLMYYFFQQKRLIPFLISAFFATIVKENISLIVFMFGLYALIKKDPPGEGWVIGPLILGLGFFILTMFVITPYLRAHEGIASVNQYLSMYLNSPNKTASFGETLSSNFLTLWGTFTSPFNLRYMLELFLPLHILPFISPLTLLLGAPIFLQHFLSPAFTNHTFFYHYAATAIIFIFLAVVASLSRIKMKFSRPFYFCLLILTIVGYATFTQKFSPEFYKRIAGWQDNIDPVRQDFMDKIPKSASIVSTFNFLDKLSTRKELYSFHNVWNNNAPFTGKTPFTLPQDLSYALIDWNCHWLWNDLRQPDKKLSNLYLQRINNFYFSQPWKTVSAVMDITLLSINDQATKEPALVENSQQPFPGALNSKLSLTIGEHLKLVGFKIRRTSSPSPKHILPLVMIWQIDEPTEDFLAIVFKIASNNKVILPQWHPIGYAFNATPLWQKGQYVKESYNLLLPAIPQSEIILNISIFNISKNTYEPIFLNGEELNNINLRIPDNASIQDR